MKNKIIFLLAVILAVNLQCAEQTVFAQDGDTQIPQAVQAAPADDLADALLGDEEIKKKAQTEKSTKKQLTNNGCLLNNMSNDLIDHMLSLSLSSFDDIKQLSLVSKSWRDKLSKSKLLPFIKKIKKSGNNNAENIGIQADLVEIVKDKIAEFEQSEQFKELLSSGLTAETILNNYKSQILTDTCRVCGGLEIVKYIMGQSKDIDLFFPIHEAIKAGYINLTELLISNYPNFFQERERGRISGNVLHDAVQSGKLSMYKLILKKLHNIPSHQIKNFISQSNAARNSVLHEAILKGSHDIVKAICFESGYHFENSQDQYEFWNNNGYKVDNELMAAMRKNDPYMVSTIINSLTKKGLHDTLKSLFNEEAFDIALKSDSDNFLNLLLSHGMELQVQHFSDAVKYCFLNNNFNKFNLMLSTLSPDEAKSMISKCVICLFDEENIDIVTALIKKFNISIDKPIDESGETLLHEAAKNCDIPAIEFLLKIGAGKSVNMQDNQGFTPLIHYALEANDAEGFIEVLELFLAHNLNINILDNEGRNILRWIDMSEYIWERSEILETLIKNGLKINAVDNNGNSLLHDPQTLNNLDEYGDYLIKSGLEVTIKNKLGQSPLHILALSEGLDLCSDSREDDFDCCGDSISILLKAAPQLLNEKDNNGQTPLHYAIRNGCINAVQVLLKYNADVTIQDNQGNTPLHLAVLLNDNEQPRERCSSLNKVKLLINYYFGADRIFARNNEGKTAYDLALERQFTEDQADQAQEHEEVIAILKNMGELNTSMNENFI